MIKVLKQLKLDKVARERRIQYCEGEIRILENRINNTQDSLDDINEAIAKIEE